MSANVAFMLLIARPNAFFNVCFVEFSNRPISGNVYVKIRNHPIIAAIRTPVSIVAGIVPVPNQNAILNSKIAPIRNRMANAIVPFLKLFLNSLK